MHIYISQIQPLKQLNYCLHICFNFETITNIDKLPFKYMQNLHYRQQQINIKNIRVTNATLKQTVHINRVIKMKITKKKTYHLPLAKFINK